jgi:acetyltransferase-like isoleucine patch superfamily enzyme
MSWITDNGVNNKVVLKNIFSKMHSKIVIEGDNNTIILDDDIKLRYSKITIVGDNNHCYLKKNSSLKYITAVLRNESSIVIGKDTTIGKVEMIAVESSKIHIGDDCMIASGCELRTSDMHPIYSINSGLRINLAKDIFIGNHVWLAKYVVINKGSYIANNICIGLGAIVTSKFEEENVILAGIPAKVIKKNVIWGRSTSNKTLYDDASLGAFNIKKEVNQSFLLKVKIKLKKLFD